MFGGAALLWLPLWVYVAREAASQISKSAPALSAAAVPAAATAAKVAYAVPAAGMAAHPVGASTAAVLCSGQVQQDTATLRAASREASIASENRSAHPLLDAIVQNQQQQIQQQEAVPAAPVTSTGLRPASTGSSRRRTSNVGFWALMRCKEVWAIAVAQYAAGW